jgi:threonine dehydrogenase-like Zn-dependent dehydrogenase
LGPNATVAVMGCGTVGLGVIAAVRRLAPDATIVAIDMFDFKLGVARAAGADHCVLAGEGAADQVRELLSPNDKRGADCVFEATGNPKAISQAMDMVRKMGKLLAISICAKAMHPVSHSLSSPSCCYIFRPPTRPGAVAILFRQYCAFTYIYI